MKTFEIDEEALQKGWGAEGQYWFFLKDYSIVEDTELSNLEPPENMENEDFFNLHDIIPYFNVKRIELEKAYVNSLENKKLKEKLSSFDDSVFIEMFWKYFNVYPKLFEGYEAFQNKFILEKAEKWCKKNNINYVLK